jgi:glycosyltransferase involved in cell wall biosynthesis
MLNAAAYVRECLGSALAQLGPDDEVFVADNGSTDGCADIVRGIGDARIQLIHAEAKGPSAARNAGLRLARGRYITFLDADDMWAPGRLPKMLAAMSATPGANAVYGRVRVLYDAGQQHGHDDIDGQLVQNWGLWSYMFERSLVEQVGLLAEELQMGEDTDFILRARRGGMKCAVCDEVVTLYRRHAANVTNDRAELQRSAMRTFARNITRLRAERNGDA